MLPDRSPDRLGLHSAPLSCGFVDIGQTRRCVNDRRRGHSASLRSFPDGELAVHARHCGCEPDFSSVRILEIRDEGRVRDSCDLHDQICYQAEVSFVFCREHKIKKKENKPNKNLVVRVIRV